jgi:hypothetical protein
MCVLAVLKKGIPRMSDTFESGCISSTTKSTGTKNSRILTRIFSAIPMGTELIDLLNVGTLMLARVLSGQACNRLQ